MQHNKKILIAYASAGAGHAKAAYAIDSALKKINRDDIEVKLINTLDYSTPFLKKSYPAIYLFLVNRIPTIWGLGYYLFDTRIVYRAFIALARRINHSLNCARLVDFLKQYNPDVILNTHFLGIEVMAHMKRQGMLRDAKLISVVTDYFMHSFWVDKAVDYFCVAQEESKMHLIKRGVSPDKIRVLGVPIDPAFAIKKDRKELSAKLGINENLHTVLIGSGGFGVGPIKELVKELSDIGKGVQLLVVCGRNPKLYNEISEFAKSSETPIKVYEFIDNMDELMEVSDIMVTKSGGMTSSEAMAKDLPMIITQAIPGQEARNSRYLVKSEAAIYAGSAKKAKKAIVDILNSDSKIELLREKIRKIKKPTSSLDTANFAITLLGK
jgi:processive 1,2-diacylglycerol beta-glucosyltransferase